MIWPWWAQVTDRVAVMQQGEIVEQGVTRSIAAYHMQHPYGRALLAAAELQPKRSVPPPRGRHAGFAGERHRSRISAQAALVVARGAGVSGSGWRFACVHAGETVGLVGESGSGKSSLLRVVLALERPRAGEDSICWAKRSQRREAPTCAVCDVRFKRCFKIRTAASIRCGPWSA
jgi:peptide/nickel transport system ATP-binding protein